MYGYIYKITHLPSGRYYIGQHRGEFDKKYWGSGKVIRKLLNKHPLDEFERIVLDVADSEEELNEMEAKYVTLKTLDDELCVNLITGGSAGLQSQEVKDLISEGRIKYFSNPKNRIKQSESAKKRYEDPKQRKLLSESKKRQYAEIPDYREKTGKINKGKHWFTNGKENVFSHICPEGFRKGLTMSKEHKAKIVAHNKTLSSNSEFKARMSKTAKASWAKRKENQ